MDPDHPLFNSRRNYSAHGLEGYAAFFDRCTKSEGMILEATPDYFYQQTAFKVLINLQPPPTILFILREPAERAYSLFQFAKNNVGILPASYSFTSFVDDVLDVKSNRFNRRPILQNAVEHGKYALHIEPWLDALGESRIKILLFEDLVSQPGRFMDTLTRDLSIASGFYDAYTFEQKNPTYSVRSRRFQSFKNNIGSLRALVPFRRFLMPVYKRLNVKPGRPVKTQEDTQTLYRLCKLFAAYNKTLAALTGLDLSVWENIAEAVKDVAAPSLSAEIREELE